MSTPTQGSAHPRASFHIHTLGCKVNRAESERIAALLMLRGWQRAGMDEAQVGIVNTCTVTGEADTKNRKVIRAMLKAGCSQVIVTGCAINIASDHYAALDSRITCICDKESIPDEAARLVGLTGGAPKEEAALAPLEDEAPGAGMEPPSAANPFPSRVGEGFRTRVDVKIQDGCNHACTYCIVHTARGPARSVAADEVVAEVAHHASCGVQEVVLVGIDLGAYRSDGLDLAGLLQRLLRETAIGRLRISSIEPHNLTPQLGELLARSNGRICRHLHLCMQSGSDKVLAEMGRDYSADELAAKVGSLRAKVPQLALSTDVIVGFPGETEDDFAATCALVERCAFMRLHVFRYSKRPGTPAAARADQIAPEVMAERTKQLQGLGHRLAHEDARSRIGSCEQVIAERPGRGTGESYHPVLLDETIPCGELVTVRYSSLDEDSGALTGTAV